MNIKPSASERAMKYKESALERQARKLICAKRKVPKRPAVKVQKRKRQRTRNALARALDNIDWRQF